MGVPWIAPYEGTKHTFATNVLNRGVRIELVQALLAHRDRRSTERYAKLRKEAPIEAIGPRLQPGSCLSG
jgi:site-specific recombinase XerD